MNRIIILCSLAFSVAGCVDQPTSCHLPERAEEQRQEGLASENVNTLGSLPKFLREKEITCAIFAEAVNHYVDMGEEKGIEALKSLAAAKAQCQVADHAVRMALTCRVLFEPRGQHPLPRPLFGTLIDLPWNSMPAEKWPFRPVAKAGSSYFVLSESYIVTGLFVSPSMYVNHCCELGRFRRGRVPIPTRTQALHDFEILRGSTAWKELKWQDRGDGFQYNLEESPVLEYLIGQAARIPPEKSQDAEPSAAADRPRDSGFQQLKSPPA